MLDIGKCKMYNRIKREYNSQLNLRKRKEDGNGKNMQIMWIPMSGQQYILSKLRHKIW